jgi:Flp pilus assembly protein TadD
MACVRRKTANNVDSLRMSKLPGNPKPASGAASGSLAAGARQPTWLLVLMLMLVTVAVYCPTATFQFIDFDDGLLFWANPHVRAGLTAESFKWAWTNAVAGVWQPITMLSFMLDCQLFGGKPWGPHLVNVLLHAANTALLFALLKRMTGAVWRSAMVAALFALHPLHVESVAWVSERKDVLSTLFWLLATWAYVRRAGCKDHNATCRAFYGLSLLFFALGLMSKPMLVTLPFTLLLLDYWPLGRIREGWKLVTEKIPYFAMSIASCVATLWTHHQSGVIVPLKLLSPGERICNALQAYVSYIGMMCWPRHLTPLYLPKTNAWPWWTAAALLLAACSALVLWQWRRRPWIALGWFWYLGTLVPVIGLVQVGRQTMADRFIYIPSIGLFVILVWGCREIAEAWRLGRPAAAIAACALGACAVLTVHQEFFWRDSTALNTQMINVDPANYIAHNNLAALLYQEGRTNEAISHLRDAIQANPNYADARYNLGKRSFEMNQWDDAITNLTVAVRLTPEATFQPEVWRELGLAYAKQDRFHEAEGAFLKLLRLQPGNADAYGWLGNALAAQKDLTNAIACYLTELKINPVDFRAEYNVGYALKQLGMREEAAEHFRKALSIKPDYGMALEGLSALQRSSEPAQGGK